MAGGSSHIREVLERLGTRRGDTVFVHCDLRRFGLVRGADRQIGLHLDAPELFAALHDIVGINGTIVVPAFSYSWTRGETFDLATSSSAMGRFSEYVRGLEGAMRSRHPLLSFAACGRDAGEVASAGADLPYGEGSVYTWLVRRDTLMLMAGVPYCSLKDHVEFLRRVPYRYVKRFCGTTNDGETERQEQCRHFVRYRHGGEDVEFTSFLEGLSECERQAAIRRMDFGSSEISAIRAGECVALLDAILSADPYRFVCGGYVAPDAFGFLRDACCYRAAAGWSVAADAYRTADGETWTWEVRGADATVLQRMGLEGGPVDGAIRIDVGNAAWGSEVCLNAVTERAAGDDSVIAFLHRLVEHPESQVRWPA